PTATNIPLPKVTLVNSTRFRHKTEYGQRTQSGTKMFSQAKVSCEIRTSGPVSENSSGPRHAPTATYLLFPYARLCRRAEKSPGRCGKRLRDQSVPLLETNSLGAPETSEANKKNWPFAKA